MIRALLAVHSRVRPLVLPPDLFASTDGLEIIDPGDALWEQGWPRDDNIDAVLTGWGTPPIDEEALDGMTGLRAILHIGGSIRELISSDPWTRGIEVVTAADINNEAVADFVHASALLSLKGSFRAAATMQERQRLPGPAAGPGSYRQTVGLVSFGSVARKVRDRLRGNEAHVLAWDPFVDDDVFRTHDVERVSSLIELFRRSAVVSLHTPLIPGETEQLITGELINALPPGATFINTARGALVDEHALATALAARADILAVLDVTFPEPPEPDSALYRLPNVILTGHTAGSVGSENHRMAQHIRSALDLLAAGSPLVGTVGRGQLTTRA